MLNLISEQLDDFIKTNIRLVEAITVPMMVGKITYKKYSKRKKALVEQNLWDNFKTQDLNDDKEWMHPSYCNVSWAISFNKPSIFD